MVSELIGERLQIFSLFTYSLEKPQKIVDIFLITYKHFDPFAITKLVFVEFVVASSCRVAGLSI
jgi:hypothetical protein